jgi:hypothetical protein
MDAPTEEKVWLWVLRLVMVRTRWAGELVAVWMPKSSSLGEKTMVAGGFVVAGRFAVWVVALAACAVRVPGPEPLRTMLHSAPGLRVEVQLVAEVKPVAVI